jgi:hypothetical protein
MPQPSGLNSCSASPNRVTRQAAGATKRRDGTSEGADDRPKSVSV